MSQEQPPIRSRRELRQARDERLEANQEAGTPGPGAVPPASKSGPDRIPSSGTAAGHAVDPGEPTEAEITGRRRMPGPVDSVRSTAGSERSSQVRARDRATLRTIKELAEKEGNLAGGGPPTRRQLRLMQLAAETAPATAANMIVPASPRTRATPVVSPARRDAPKGPARGRCPDGTPRQKASPTASRPGARRSRRPRRRARRAGSRGNDRGTGPGRPRTPGPAGPKPAGQDGAHQRHGPRRRRSGRSGGADRPGRTGRGAEPPRRRQAEAGGAEQPAGAGPRNDPDHGQQPGHGHTPGICPGPRRGAARHEAPCHVLRSGGHQPGPPG